MQKYAVYWPENVIDWLGKWRPTCVQCDMREDKNFKVSDVSGPSVWIFTLCQYASYSGKQHVMSASPGPALLHVNKP
jgi:hypothetical protein